MTAGRRIAVLLGLADDGTIWTDTDYASSPRHEQPEGPTHDNNESSPASRDASAIAHGGRSVTIRRAPAKPVTIAPQNKDDLRTSIDALRSSTCPTFRPTSDVECSTTSAAAARR
jgi:hypothetical protein